MARETFVHIVARGEYIYRIADRYGLTPQEIWDHPANERLRGSGRSPSMLAEGDVLYVPKTEAKWTAVNAGKTHPFRANVRSVEVVFRIRGADGALLKGEPYEVAALDRKGSSDGDGKITLKDVPIQTTLVRVHLPKRDLMLHVTVGGLDPVTTRSGLAQRLAHLGYLHSTGIRPADDALDAAVERFCLERAPDASTDQEIHSALIQAHAES